MCYIVIKDGWKWTTPSYYEKISMIEYVVDKVVSIQHIAGNINIDDLFTKEHEDPTNYLQLRDTLLSPTPVVTQ